MPRPHIDVPRRSARHYQTCAPLLKDTDLEERMCFHVIKPYLDVVLQLLPPLLQRFGPQVGAPFAGEIWCLDNLLELKVTKEVKSTHTG